MNYNPFGIIYTSEEEVRIRHSIESAVAFFGKFGRAGKNWTAKQRKNEGAIEEDDGDIVFFTAIEIQDKYGISKHRIARAKEAGRIYPAKIGNKGAYLYKKRDIENLLAMLNKRKEDEPNQLQNEEKE